MPPRAALDGDRGRIRGGSERGGGPGGRGNRSRGRGIVVEAGAAAVEAGSYPLLYLPTPSSGRVGSLPAEHIETTGVKRRKYGNAVTSRWYVSVVLLGRQVT